MPPTNQSFSFHWVNSSPVVFWLVPVILLEFLRTMAGLMKMPKNEVILREPGPQIVDPGMRYPFDLKISRFKP
jgi:hypothetical protein